MFPHAAHSVLLCGDSPHLGQKRASLCRDTAFARRLHGAVVSSVGCSSMDPGHHCCCCDVDGVAPSNSDVGCYRNHGILPGWHFGYSVVDEMRQR